MKKGIYLIMLILLLSIISADNGVYTNVNHNDYSVYGVNELNVTTINANETNSTVIYQDGTRVIDWGNEGNLNVNSSNYWDRINSVNATVFSTVNEVLGVVKTWWDGLYCQLTGCTMSGNINLGGNSITNGDTATFTGNVTANGFQGTLDCAEIGGTTGDNLCTVTNTDRQMGTDGIYLSNDSTTHYFDESKLNSTITRQLSTTYYNVSSITIATGTGAGNLIDITRYNSIPYNITEDTGSIDVVFNFTGIDEFNQIVIRYRNPSGETHPATVYLWDFDDDEWESYNVLGSTEGEYIIEAFGVFDSESHISETTVSMRIYMAATAGTDKWNFDWITISKGIATPSSTETDPFSVHKDGSEPLTADWNAGLYNITAKGFIGIIDCALIGSATGNLCLITQAYDSNASTACSGATTYLNGENGCVDISSVYAPITITQTYDSNASTACSGATTYLNGENGCVDIDSVYLKAEVDGSITNELDNNNISVSSVQVTGTTTKTLTIEQKTNLGIALTNITTTFADIGAGDSNASTACSGATTYLNGEDTCVDISSVYASIGITQAYDSNASTACSGATTYLNGENGCVDISSVYASIGITQAYDSNVTTVCTTGEYLEGDASCDTPDASGQCTGELCGGGHTHPASEVTNSTFGAGTFAFQGNITVADDISVTVNNKYCLNVACTSYMLNNGTGVIIK